MAASLFGGRDNTQMNKRITLRPQISRSSPQSNQFALITPNLSNKICTIILIPIATDCVVQAVRETARHACKCHGVSGSCTLQTCWLQLADLGEAAAFLKVRYDLAIRLDGLRGTGNSAKAAAGTGSETHASTALLTLKTEKLVYMEDSPDYCGRNDSLGEAGAAGRECRRPGGNSTSNSCVQLCTACGLSVTERKVEVIVTCNCTFTWCCKVTCDHCHRILEKFYCEGENPFHHPQPSQSLPYQRAAQPLPRIALSPSRVATSGPKDPPYRYRLSLRKRPHSGTRPF
uniref:protein Wnt-8b-like n=1 Tax=Myxine glutinosa TaxID=7769 RepID=UPI00358DE9EA